MKTCSACHLEKDDTAFSWKKAGVLRNAWCKPCQKIYKDAHYQQNRERYHAKAAQQKRDLAQWLREYKDQQPCVDCKKRWPYYVLDFDHVRGAKRSAVARLVYDCSSMTALLEEISKCELVCANCHRERTQRRAPVF